MVRPMFPVSSVVALFEEQHQLLEEAPDCSASAAPADCDLVAPDVDRYRERGPTIRSSSMALAEQAHHQVVAGDEDLQLGR